MLVAGAIISVRIAILAVCDMLLPTVKVQGRPSRLFRVCGGGCGWRGGGVLGDDAGSREIVTLAEVHEKRRHEHHMSPHEFKHAQPLQTSAHAFRAAASSCKGRL
jgi:hypothetical protein